MKKLSAFILALLLAFSMCACGGGAEEGDDIYGTYELYAMDYDENTVVLTEELLEGENYITLKRGGIAVVCMEDEKANGKWKLKGENLTIISDDGNLEGTLADGILALEVEDGNFYFVSENASKKSIKALKALTLDEVLYGVTEAPTPAPETPEPVPETEPADPRTEVQKLWNGWWYGCAYINGCEKGWEWANGSIFDMALYVELDADGKGTFGIHDPYGEMALGPNNNRFITISCHADENYIYGDSGKTFGYEIKPDEWIVYRDITNDAMIHLSSSHTDSDGNKMGYDFTFMPWGSRWEGEEIYTYSFEHFDEYLEKIDAGWTSPYDEGSGENPAGPVDPAPGGLSPLLGSNPSVLDVGNKGAVRVYYPGDQFKYDADYGMLKNASSGVNIIVDPMLGSTNLAELKASYEKNNSKEDEYSLVETTVNGYKALILKYTDWLGSTMRVDIDFGGNHDGYYGMSFSVKADALKLCDTDLVWAIIQSMEVVK